MLLAFELPQVLDAGVQISEILQRLTIAGDELVEWIAERLVEAVFTCDGGRRQFARFVMRRNPEDRVDLRAERRRHFLVAIHGSQAAEVLTQSLLDAGRCRAEALEDRRNLLVVRRERRRAVVGKDGDLILRQQSCAYEVQQRVEALRRFLQPSAPEQNEKDPLRLRRDVGRERLPPRGPAV